MSTMHQLFFEYFTASVSSGPFQTLFSRLMISCQLVTFSTYLKDRLVSQARPFSFPQQWWSHIGYEYWNRSALQNRKSLICETKSTVCKHKQKLMQPSLNKHELIAQISPINKTTDVYMVWVKQKLPVKQWIYYHGLRHMFRSHSKLLGSHVCSNNYVRPCLLGILCLCFRLITS